MQNVFYRLNLHFSSIRQSKKILKNRFDTSIKVTLDKKTTVLTTASNLYYLIYTRSAAYHKILIGPLGIVRVSTCVHINFRQNVCTIRQNIVESGFGLLYRRYIATNWFLHNMHTMTLTIVHLTSFNALERVIPFLRHEDLIFSNLKSMTINHFRD